MDRRWVQAYERGVPPALSYPRTSLQHFLAASADRFPSRAALLFYGRPMSYRELDRATNRFANA
jgi:acyl-CoA synthetase (AMP-forming)/AMP-acid ligase II